MELYWTRLNDGVDVVRVFVFGDLDGVVASLCFGDGPVACFLLFG